MEQIQGKTKFSKKFFQQSKHGQIYQPVSYDQLYEKMYGKKMENIFDPYASATTYRQLDLGETYQQKVRAPWEQAEANLRSSMYLRTSNNNNNANSGFSTIQQGNRKQHSLDNLKLYNHFYKDKIQSIGAYNYKKNVYKKDKSELTLPKIKQNGMNQLTEEEQNENDNQFDEEHDQEIKKIQQEILYGKQQKRKKRVKYYNPDENIKKEGNERETSEERKQKLQQNYQAVLEAEKQKEEKQLQEKRKKQKEQEEIQKQLEHERQERKEKWQKEKEEQEKRNQQYIEQDAARQAEAAKIRQEKEQIYLKQQREEQEKLEQQKINKRLAMQNQFRNASTGRMRKKTQNNNNKNYNNTNSNGQGSQQQTNQNQQQEQQRREQQEKQRKELEAKQKAEQEKKQQQQKADQEKQQKAEQEKKQQQQKAEQDKKQQQQKAEQEKLQKEKADKQKKEEEEKKKQGEENPKGGIEVTLHKLTELDIEGYSVAVDIFLMDSKGIVKDRLGKAIQIEAEEVYEPKKDTCALNINHKFYVQPNLLYKNNKAEAQNTFLMASFVLEPDEDDEEEEEEQQELGWVGIPIFDGNGFRQGKFSDNLYEAPMQKKMPVNKSKAVVVGEILQYTLKFSILDK